MSEQLLAFHWGKLHLLLKFFEVKDAIKNGAEEIDYVINIGELKAGNLAYIEQEMKKIVAACRAENSLSKVILENCYLTDEEKISVCEIAKKINPDFVKTSTGFGTGGATVEDVKLMKETVGAEVKVKAAGGIRDFATAKAMIEAGAERLGTSSGLQIVNEYKSMVKEA